MRSSMLAVAAGLLACVQAAHAQQVPADTPKIVVSGEGEATVPPDLAMLSLSVMREAKTAREALDANTAAMAAVIAAMKSSGIADRDLQTGTIQISPRYTYTNKDDGSQTAELVAYQVTNTLSVRVRDIGKTGELLDKAVTLGVNQGGGVSFTNTDPSKTLTEARKKAVADAVDKARTLASAAGVTLGRVLEISDQTMRAMPVPMAARAFAAAPAPQRDVAIESGENSYSVQVTVTFELR